MNVVKCPITGPHDVVQILNSQVGRHLLVIEVNLCTKQGGERHITCRNVKSAIHGKVIVCILCPPGLLQVNTGNVVIPVAEITFNGQCSGAKDLHHNDVEDIVIRVIDAANLLFVIELIAHRSDYRHNLDVKALLDLDITIIHRGIADIL